MFFEKESKKYKIIYADPPWSYFNGGVTQGGVDAQYPTMKLEDIKNLRVGDISADTSVLFWDAWGNDVVSYTIFPRKN